MFYRDMRRTSVLVFSKPRQRLEAKFGIYKELIVNGRILIYNLNFVGKNSSSSNVNFGESFDVNVRDDWLLFHQQTMEIILNIMSDVFGKSFQGIFTEVWSFVPLSNH